MKKIILCGLSLILFSFYGFAQKKSDVAPAPQLPIDKITKKITYDGVVEVTGANANLLYQRALKWFRSNYKNPTEVIRENDSVEHKIVGKPRFKIYNAPDKDGLKTDAGIVQYTITVAAREGRYKFELTDFNWKQASNYPCERWYDKTLPSYTPAYDGYIQQTDSTVNSVISDLKKALKADKPVKKDDW